MPLPFDGEEPLFVGDNDHGDAVPHRTCRRCRKTLTEDHFYRFMRDGKPKLSSMCKECKRGYWRGYGKAAKGAGTRPDRCDCCGCDEIEVLRRGKWALDHDHETESFRGWLCKNCNVGIGLFGESIERLQQAIDYLKRTTKDNSDA